MGGFVEQEQVWTQDRRSRYANQFLHATGERARDLLGIGLKPGLRQSFACVLLALASSRLPGPKGRMPVSIPARSSGSKPTKLGTFEMAAQEFYEAAFLVREMGGLAWHMPRLWEDHQFIVLVCRGQSFDQP